MLGEQELVIELGIVECLYGPALQNSFERGEVTHREHVDNESLLGGRELEKACLPVPWI